MGKGGGSYKVAKYFMSSWWGFGVGPVDKLLAIFVNDKKVWDGEITESSVISIDDQDAFGGLKKEGGVFGTMTYLAGEDTQTIPQYLAAKMGRTTANCPAHRGIASVFFSGGLLPSVSTVAGTGRTSTVRPKSGVGGLAAAFSNRATRGFYWRANYPAVPAIKFKAQRAPKVLNPLHRMIGDDANVVHMIYEVMVNTDWGIGTPESAIDTASFNDAAERVFNEEIGVSLLWSAQQTGEDFIQGLLEYIQGMIFVHPRTGLLTIKLVRGDYDPEDLFEITPDNANLSGYQRKMWGETVNELVVTWTNPENEQTETVSVQDIGNIAMQGGIVSQSKDYSGVRSADLAKRLGARDMRSIANPLMSCRAVINRSAWDIVPGDVVKLTWPEHGLSQIAMRVTEVDYGKITDSAITVTLVEDVFGLDIGTYYTPPDTSWTGGEIAPKVLDYQMGMTLPYYMTARNAKLSDMVDPDVYVAVLGGDNSPDISEYLILYPAVYASGDPVWLGSERRGLLSKSTLGAALPFPTTSTSVIAVTDPTPGAGYGRGTIVVIGEDEATQELCVINALSDDTVTLRRGMMDTTPKSWPSGTPIWFIPATADVVEDVERTGDTPVTYRLLSITSEGILNVEDADDLDVDLSRRPWLPLRPANCKVNGVSSGTVTAIGAGTLSLTWANRNRLYEDTVLLNWTAASVTPEVGQTTTITVYADDQTTVLSTIDGLTGTSYTLNTSAFGAETQGWVKFTSKRGTDESLQGHMIKVILA